MAVNNAFLGGATDRLQKSVQVFLVLDITHFGENQPPKTGGDENDGSRRVTLGFSYMGEHIIGLAKERLYVSVTETVCIPIVRVNPGIWDSRWQHIVICKPMKQAMAPVFLEDPCSR
jgi:hypothetical protein